jgi:single-strand DNA-binding protein
LKGNCEPAHSRTKKAFKKYTTEVVAENFTLLGRKSDFEDDNIKSTIKSDIDMPDDLNADDIL